MGTRDLCERIPAFPSSARARQDYSPVVRRKRGSVGNGACLFSSHVPAGEFVRSRPDQVPGITMAGADPHRLACTEPCPFADRTFRNVEACRKREPGCSNLHSACRDGWAAFPALICDQPSSANLVRSGTPRPLAIPVLRTFKCRIALGVDKLSGVD